MGLHERSLNIIKDVLPLHYLPEMGKEGVEPSPSSHIFTGLSIGLLRLQAIMRISQETVASLGSDIQLRGIEPLPLP